MKGIRSLIAWWRSKRSDPLPPIRMPVVRPTGLSLTGAPSPDVLASRALLQAAVSVPRRAPVSRAAPVSSASRSSGDDEGMSMLPAAMLLASHCDDGNAADAGSFGSSWSAPVSRGGSFDGGGASGNWDAACRASSSADASSDSCASPSSSD
ncbi:hypothetical protein D9M68_122980 [compost metagenome]